jgi:hypothetical protein
LLGCASVDTSRIWCKPESKIVMNGLYTPLLLLALAAGGHVQEIIEITQPWSSLAMHGTDVHGANLYRNVLASIRHYRLLAEVPGLDWHVRTSNSKNTLNLARDANDVRNDIFSSG